MKPKELRQKNKEELMKLLEELEEKKRIFRFNLSLGKVKNTSEIRQIKRDIARIKTIFKEKYAQKSS